MDCIRCRILATFTLPPDHHRIALVTPLVSGGSLSGILEWRTRLSVTPKTHRNFPRFNIGKKNEDLDDEAEIGKLDEEEIKAVTKQVLEGLAYLHHRGFLHVSLSCIGTYSDAKSPLIDLCVARFESWKSTCCARRDDPTGGFWCGRGYERSSDSCRKTARSSWCRRITI